MGITKIYKVRIPSYGDGPDSLFDIPVKIDDNRRERTIDIDDLSLPNAKEYLRNMPSDWYGALVFPVRKNDETLRPPKKGETLRINGRDGRANIGIIEEVIKYKNNK